MSERKDNQNMSHDNDLSRREFIAASADILFGLGIGIAGIKIVGHIIERHSAIKLNTHEQQLFFYRTNPINPTIPDLNKEAKEPLENVLESNGTLSVESIAPERNIGVRVDNGDIFDTNFLNTFGQEDSKLSLRRFNLGSRLRSRYIRNFIYDLAAFHHTDSSVNSLFTVSYKTPGGNYLPLKADFAFRVNLAILDRKLESDGWVNGEYTIVGVPALVVFNDVVAQPDVAKGSYALSDLNLPLRIVNVNPDRNILTDNDFNLGTLTYPRSS